MLCFASFENRHENSYCNLLWEDPTVEKVSRRPQALFCFAFWTFVQISAFVANKLLLSLRPVLESSLNFSSLTRSSKYFITRNFQQKNLKKSWFATKFLKISKSFECFFSVDQMRNSELTAPRATEKSTQNLFWVQHVLTEMVRNQSGTPFHNNVDRSAFFALFWL